MTNSPRAKPRSVMEQMHDAILKIEGIRYKTQKQINHYHIRDSSICIVMQIPDNRTAMVVFSDFVSKLLQKSPSGVHQSAIVVRNRKDVRSLVRQLKSAFINRD